MAQASESARHPYNPSVELAANLESLRTATELPELEGVHASLRGFEQDLSEIAEATRTETLEAISARVRLLRMSINVLFTQLELSSQINGSPSKMAALYDWQHRFFRVTRFIFLVLDKQKSLAPV